MSSKPLSAGQARTYHAREFASERQNYWSRDQQGFSEWQGRLAEQWGLSGSVGNDHFARLSEGQHPFTEEQLVRHQVSRTYEGKGGREVTSVEHRAGWDATFSAPKSVSLTALVGGDERVREAHRESVRVALGEIEHYTRNADFFTRSFGSSTTNFAESRVNAYAQDHWRAARTLTFDYGLRYEVNRLPSSLPTTRFDFSPRFGLAWTPQKSLVVRSGFGIFYDRYLLSTVNRVLEFDGVRASSQIVEGPAAASLYASGTVPTAPLPGVAPSIWRADPHLINPYSEVGSLSVEQTLPLQTTLTAEYQFVHGVHLGRTVNSNLQPPVLLTPVNAASLGIASPTAQQIGRPVFTPARVDPAYDAVNRFSTTAGSNFNGATVTLNRQFQDNFELLAGYTYSKTIDDASSDSEQPQNPFDPGAERALSQLDQRHRFTLSGLWLIGPDLGDPADAAANANPGPLTRIFNGIEFAPIFQVASGFRANPLTGLDSNREHIYPFAARPAGYARNSLSTSPNIDFDLRILKMVPLGTGHLDIVAESFNLLNHRNVSLLNTAFGLNAQPQSGFSRPIATSTARRIQFSLDYEF